MRTHLRPIIDRDLYSKDIAQAIDYAVFVTVFKPLLDILDPDTKENAKSMTLVKAFEVGRIQFIDGLVLGQFNATLSKQIRELGGRYLPSKKGFKLSLSQLPPEIRSTIVRRGQIEKDKLDAIKKKVSELKNVEAVSLKFDTNLEFTISELEKQFHRVTPKDLEVPANIDGFVKKQLKEKFEDNVHDYIYGWSQAAVDRLRVKVEENALAGYRADTLQAIIMSEYGITKKRAKQIAKQEMSIFVSKYRQVRYEAVGVNKYIWSTSQDERVRQDHKDLNGREFSFDDPPIVDKHTGRRANPGEDYGCRCVALPIVTFAGV